MRFVAGTFLYGSPRLRVSQNGHGDEWGGRPAAQDIWRGPLSSPSVALLFHDARRGSVDPALSLCKIEK